MISAFSSSPLQRLNSFIIALLKASWGASIASAIILNESAKASSLFFRPTLLKISVYCFSLQLFSRIFSYSLSFAITLFLSGFMPIVRAIDFSSSLSPSCTAFFMVFISPASAYILLSRPSL